jgi:hypothetical protein
VEKAKTMDNMKEKIQKQIEDWENAGVGTIESDALRIAALLSAFEEVPVEVLEALKQIESGPVEKSSAIYTVVKFLRQQI